MNSQVRGQRLRAGKVGRFPHLGISLARITVDGLIQEVQRAFNKGELVTFSYAHFHTANLLRNNVRLRGVFDGIDYVVPDGAAMLWSANIAGLHMTRENDLVLELMMPVLFPEASRREWSLFLIGGLPGIASTAAERLSALYPRLRIVGTQQGYVQSAMDLETVAQRISALRPTIVVVGLGQPNQEEFVVKYGNRLAANAIICCGGYLDKLAESPTIYPQWVHRTHLYWLHRLVSEPRRLWRRYSIGAATFLWIVVSSELLPRLRFWRGKSHNADS